MNKWLEERLACPRDRAELTRERCDQLVCSNGHRYPLIDDIPIMLINEAEPTHRYCSQTFEKMRNRNEIQNVFDASTEVDSFVQSEIVGTCGSMYQHLKGRLKRYPIPKLRGLDFGEGKYLLDIGCNWGRWCISAAQSGYVPIGIDPCLDAIRAAYRVSHQLGVSAIYLVADARYLPFRSDSFDVVFSYSVLQHFDKEIVSQCLSEISRVLKIQGKSLIQMPNKFGLRQLFNQIKTGFRERGHFPVRYWSPGELIKLFNRCIGPSQISTDGFFSLNVQGSDKDLLPFLYRRIIDTSEFFRELSQRVSFLKYIADSLYINSANGKTT
ncbi:MAG: methyltransferase domain-containing protein [Chlamydiae bacterium]|nr:methyltransferase domain-containing protein [Chlamydiota bacterium]